MSFNRELDSLLYSEKAVQTECLVAEPPDVLSSGIADLAINELLSRSGNTSMLLSVSGSSSNGKTWLEYNNPPRRSFSQRRVVSDTVTSEPNTHTISGGTRVVSLPEPITLDSCVAFSQHYQEESPHYQGYPTDRTSSPCAPSTPDSLVIVGNECHVPTSFFQPHADENGWSSWASSPPRPIPALHGPSSLPYARCPSGAEGTVVEGDDLATKVWGLGSDEAHRFRSRSPQPLRSSRASAFSPEIFDSHNVAASALERQQDTVIDLANPPTFYSYPTIYNSAGRRLGTSSSTVGYQSQIDLCASAVMSQSDVVETASPTNSFPGLTTAVSGKELIPRGPPRTHLRSTTLSSLSSAAPSFIPTCRSKHSDLEGGCIRDGTNYEFSYVARDVPLRPYTHDLTPSSTASSLWSPVFQCVPTIVLGDYEPRIHSPPDSYSDGFITKVNGQDFNPVPQRLCIERGIKSSIETFHPVINNSGSVKDPGSIIHTMLQPCAEIEEENRTKACHGHCHIPQQQTLPIPMPRLVQRRLSSVGEINLGM